MKVPPVLTVTLTLNIHEVLAARVAPDRLTLPLAAVAVIDPPPHEPVSPLGVATVMPAGSVSVKAIPVSAVVAFGLLMVKLSDVDPPAAMLAAPKDFEMVGALSTMTLADAVSPVPPLVEVTAPVTLFFVPADVPVTFTENVHDPLAAIAAPERLTLPLPAVAVIVPPPHEPVSPLGVEITRPAGRLSVKATPVRPNVEFGLPAVKLRVVDPPRAMVAAPKEVIRVGGFKGVSPVVPDTLEL